MLNTTYPSQVSPHRCSTAKESDESAEADYGERLHVREERRLDEPAVDEGVRAVREPDRDQTAEHSLDRSLQQERAADKAVGGAHQAQDGDLAVALQNRHADGGADDDDEIGR